ncbi:WhiB family transcriptional regulator [[Mycobacterium] nativiensis]|uniref:Transcriptional regulator WhiB n=1 Tax=[Mycobacterium] nativiensis TaxID=2855503 RepID=A0ABU5XVK3_9MYCO|nr:WhiB family transcriptional regulator [Mycolicibacter sp. MYC340]MEB3031767.1 WhiB family transcriptional regulator [Mycolicibacter sp. MYC340]
MANSILAPTPTTDAREHWSERSLCRQIDADVFFPERDDADPTPRAEKVATAKAICALCPVRDECLQAALDNDEEFGVWGGLTKAERNRLHGSRGSRPPRILMPCGTPAAARRHARHNEPLDEACRRAAARDRQERAQRRASRAS